MMFKPFSYMLALLLSVGSASLSAAPLVIPQQQAAHFCQLFVAERLRVGDGTSGMDTSLSTLSLRARKMIQPDDSLSVEQIYAGYVLLADGWQTMRLFPHQEDGVVSWYSATDELPASIDSEHQKYIREVFPRLVAEVQANDWETVDAYIDRMIQYQCQFGGITSSSRPSSSVIAGIFLLFFASLGVLAIFSNSHSILFSHVIFVATENDRRNDRGADQCRNAVHRQCALKARHTGNEIAYQG